MTSSSVHRFFASRWRSFLSPGRVLRSIAYRARSLLSPQTIDSDAEWPFDEELYVQANLDVAKAITRGQFQSGLHHFVNNGRRDMVSGGVRRSPFKLRGYILDYDEGAYLTDNPDVAALVANGFFASGYEHFLNVGYAECLRGERMPYAAERAARLKETRDGEAVRRNGSRAAIFAHYDQDFLIDDYVVEYVKALAQLDIDIYFVTAVADPDQLAKIAPFVIKIFIKNDAGRDFGSWYLALQNLGIDHFNSYEYLFLVNDSVYFPISDPKIMLDAMETRKFNLWGITNSRGDGIYHIQSYFVAYDRAARSVLLEKFLLDYERFLFLTKWGQILTFEFTVAKFAMDAWAISRRILCN